MSLIRSYILVDDDPINNSVNRMIIKMAIAETDIQSFTDPEEALKFIQNEFSRHLIPTILFLDINMPTLTGWEFMEEFEKFSKEIKQQLSVYMLSSSVDVNDQNKAEDNRYIKRFLSKPLQKELILSLAAL